MRGRHARAELGEVDGGQERQRRRLLPNQRADLRVGLQDCLPPLPVPLRGRSHLSGGRWTALRARRNRAADRDGWMRHPHESQHTRPPLPTASRRRHHGDQARRLGIIIFGCGINCDSCSATFRCGGRVTPQSNVRALTPPAVLSVCEAAAIIASDRSGHAADAARPPGRHAAFHLSALPRSPQATHNLPQQPWVTSTWPSWLSRRASAHTCARGPALAPSHRPALFGHARLTARRPSGTRRWSST